MKKPGGRSAAGLFVVLRIAEAAFLSGDRGGVYFGIHDRRYNTGTIIMCRAAFPAWPYPKE
jgi:hypothetical protein